MIGLVLLSLSRCVYFYVVNMSMMLISVLNLVSGVNSVIGSSIVSIMIVVIIWVFSMKGSWCFVIVV